MPLRLEQLDHTLAVVALHFNHTVFDRAAAATGVFQFLAQLGQARSIQQYALNQRNGLAPTALGLARDAHHAVALG